MAPEERAREGVFLAFQYPVEIPGVSNMYFLKARPEYDSEEPRPAGTRCHGLPALVREKMTLMEMDETLLNRAVNAGFSGGEKKRNEIFQMAVLEPKLAILDETDSGLDIDALKIVANGVNALREPGQRDACDHALSAIAELYCSGLCACASRRPDRQIGRQESRAGAGTDRLRHA